MKPTNLTFPIPLPGVPHRIARPGPPRSQTIFDDIEKAEDEERYNDLELLLYELCKLSQSQLGRTCGDPRFGQELFAKTIETMKIHADTAEDDDFGHGVYHLNDDIIAFVDGGIHFQSQGQVMEYRKMPCMPECMDDEEYVPVIEVIKPGDAVKGFVCFTYKVQKSA